MPGAREVERQIQREGLVGQLPLLNPSRDITGSQSGEAVYSGREFS